MRLTTVIILATLMQVSAFSHAQKISLSEKNAPIREIFEKIRIQSGLDFLVGEGALRKARPVSINVRNMNLDQLLEKIFSQQPLNYFVDSKTVVVVEKPEYTDITDIVRPQQEFELKGKITDELMVPIEGVTVTLKNRQMGTTSDKQGNYTIKVSGSSPTLVFSAIGFVSKEVLIGGNRVINIILTRSIEGLDEVVVVGYGANTRRNLATAISSLNVADVPVRNVPSANQVLQGQIAGVNLTVSNGTPGGTSRVSIRGISSINGDNEPLYVIDGILLSKANASYNFSGEYRQDPLSLINPADIETIDVLKDAAATAIYGSRGTNGVIIITTKRGKKGEPRMSFNQLSGLSVMPKMLDLLDPQEYMQMQREAATNFNTDMGYAPGASGYADVNKVLGVVPADPYEVGWQNIIIRDRALSTQSDLSVSGGNDHVTYFTSGGYQYQEGLIKKSSMKRHSIRTNIDYKPNEVLNLGIRLNGNHTHTTSIPNGDQGTALFQRSLEQRPYDRPFLEDGSYAVGGKDILRHNALIILDKDDTYDKNFQGLVNLYANIKFLKDFTFSTTYNSEIRLGNGHRRQEIGHPYNGGKGYVNDVRNYRYSGTFDNLLNYKKVWNGELSLDAMIGHSFFRDNYNFNQATGTEFPSDDFKHVTSATVRVADEDASYYAMESFLGRISLAYRDRYFLTASARRDGSSKFAKDNRYATFPAAAFAWAFTKEDAFKLPAVISHGKLRLSWGTTGNQDGILNYNYLPLAMGGYNYSALTGLSVTNIGNADLVWETSKQWNAGIDLSLFDGRISLIYDYFIKNSDNLLYDVPVLATSGFSSRTSNIGSMSNKGHEISISTENISRESFKWRTDFNISFIRNKVTSLIGNDPVIFGGWNAIIVGQPLGTMYGYKQLGIYQTLEEVPLPQQQIGVRAGFMKFADLDGNNIINSLDQMIIGNPQPKFSGGMTNKFTYHNFDISLFTSFSYGNDIGAMWRVGLDHSGARDYGGLAAPYYNRWTGPGTSDVIPKVTKSAFNLKNSSYYIEDGSYFRVKSLTVGYKLPSEFSRRLHLDNLRVYATGVNLLTFTRYSGYDPEASLGTDARNFGLDNLVTPQPITFMAGLSLNF